MPTKRARHDLHIHCARLLMGDFGVRKDRHLEDEAVRLIADIYDSQRMAHSLIVLSIRGFRQVKATQFLERFLQDNGTRTFSMHRGEDEF
ncbi:MAG: hypothetical protein Q7R88_00250 [bacterium]|nr:hypothetical protein [bacterium]